jgi:antitoxin component HigA of HigAB toxin-antitoxin module
MTIKPIQTKKDYATALQRLEKIFYAKPGRDEGDELEVLGTTQSANFTAIYYETNHYDFTNCTPL